MQGIRFSGHRRRVDVNVIAFNELIAFGFSASVVAGAVLNFSNVYSTNREAQYLCPAEIIIFESSLSGNNRIQMRIKLQLSKQAKTRSVAVLNI